MSYTNNVASTVTVQNVPVQAQFDASGNCLGLVGPAGVFFSPPLISDTIIGATIDNSVIGGTTAAAGSFTTLSASSTVSGTGFSTYLASPPAIGGTAAAAGSFTTLGASGSVTLSGGTTNGVAYLNGSKVLTTGSALVFDGTNLGVGTSSPYSPNGTNLEIYGSSNNARLVLNAVSGSRFSIGSLCYGTALQFTNITTVSEMARFDNSGNFGIGTSSPNASAILDAQSTTKGVRFPNMTTTQKNAISSPAAGLVVFDTTLSKLCVYSGSAWQTITSA